MRHEKSELIAEIIVSAAMVAVLRYVFLIPWNYACAGVFLALWARGGVLTPSRPAASAKDITADGIQQLDALRRKVLPIILAIERGYDYGPGDFGLDNLQPIQVRMTLAEYRHARWLDQELNVQ